MWEVEYGLVTPKPRFVSAGISFVYNTVFMSSSVFSILTIDADICRTRRIRLIAPCYHKILLMTLQQ